MPPMFVTELVFHPEMSAMGDQPSQENIDPMSVTKLVSHSEMSA